MPLSFRSVALATTLVLGACATTPQPYASNEPESLALTVTKAADLVGLKDVEIPASAKAGPPGATFGEAMTSLPGAAAFGGLQALAPPPGFTSLGGGLMGFASFFFSGPSAEEISRHSTLLAWIPMDWAPTAVAAREKLDALVAAELEAVLRETGLSAGHTWQRHTEADWNGGRYGKRPTAAFKISGGECDIQDVYCSYRLHTTVDPVEGFAPAALGGYPAWTFTRTNRLPGIARSFIDRRAFPEAWRARFPDLEVYAKLSERLPEWAYLYLAPEQVSYFDHEQGKYLLLPYPLVLNRGQAHYFVKP